MKDGPTVDVSSETAETETRRSRPASQGDTKAIFSTHESRESTSTPPMLNPPREIVGPHAGLVKGQWLLIVP